MPLQIRTALSRRRVIRWVLALLTLVVVVWVDPTRVLIGLLRREHFYEGRPTSYWSRQLRDATNPDSGSDPVLHWLHLDRWKGKPDLRVREGARTAMPVLLELLDDGDPNVRGMAAQDLVAMHDARPAEIRTALVIEFRKKPKPNGRAGSLLKRMGPDGVTVFQQMLRDNNADVRAGAALALIDLHAARPKDVMPALLEGLKGNVNFEEEASVLAGMGPDAAPAIPHLTAALREPAPGMSMSPQPQGVAGVALSYIGSPAVPAVVTVLRDPDRAIRHRAVRTLRAMGPDARGAVPLLRRMVQDPRAAPAVAYTLWCIQQDEEAVVPALVRALKDPDPERRGEATYYLALMGEDARPARRTWAAALRDPSSEVRRAAARALSALGPEAADALPDLIKALSDPDPEVVDAAAGALGRVGPAAQPALRQALKDPNPDVQGAAVCALLATDPDPVTVKKVVTDALAEKYTLSAQSAALLYLGRAGPKAAFALPALIAQLGKESDLSDDVASVRRAIAAIGSAATPPLAKELRNPRDQVRRQAAAVLGDLGPAARAAIPELRKALGDPERSVRLQAARALCTIPPEADAAALALLRVAAEGTQPQLDYEPPDHEAITILGELGRRARAAVPTLVGLLERLDAGDDAADALRRIDPANPALLPALLNVVAAHGDDCLHALTVLADMGPAAAPAIPTLIECARGKRGNARVAAVLALGRVGPLPDTALPVLLECVEKGDAALQSVAATTLGRMGPAARAALPALRALLEQSRPALSVEETTVDRAAVIVAIARIEGRPGRAVPPLLALFHHPDARPEAAQALASLGPDAASAVPALADALRFSDDSMAESAATTLGRIGPPAKAALPALRRVLRGPDSELRSAAAEAIRRITERPGAFSAPRPQRPAP